VALALNLVDDQRPAAREEALAMLVALEEALLGSGPPRRGVTGPPGAGKSTLLDALVRRARARGESVGILAIDPSSPKSGGALLGDRVRMRASAADPGVFLRSLAARDRLGGLADSARAGVFVLAAVFDSVWVETVGVGQSEAEVAQLVDTLVWVAQPGAGDLLQAMKAGVLELPDVVCVNKADLGETAERTASELAAGLSLAERSEGWSPPVLRVSARSGEGLDTLEEALEKHRSWLTETGRLGKRRRSGSRGSRWPRRSGRCPAARAGRLGFRPRRPAGRGDPGEPQKRKRRSGTMKRLSKIVVLLLLIELVIGAAIGTRIRKQLESPVSYLGSSAPAAPLALG
jgi:LAO/AO transport system kinase